MQDHPIRGDDAPRRDVLRSGSNRRVSGSVRQKAHSYQPAAQRDHPHRKSAEPESSPVFPSGLPEGADPVPHPCPKADDTVPEPGRTEENS